VDITVLVRQVVFARPSCDLLRLPVRPAIAILPAAIAFVQESLVVALQLIVQDHAIYSPALLAQPLLGAEVSAVDLRVVRQLTRLSEARVERLAWLPGAFLLAPIRFEQVSAPIAQNDGAIIRAEGGRT
jgi:hypothetical protein